MSNQSPPFLPAFGVGAPGGAIPHNASYFDTSTNPYTPYIYSAGAWHTVGSGTSVVTGDATQIQGVNVSAVAPTNGQVLTYVLANLDWEPKAPTGGANPTIVQNGAVGVASHATGITLGAGPTQGNLLIAIVSDQAAFPTPAAGWTEVGRSAASGHDDGMVMWKVAGAGESATQTPCSDTHQGTISMYEIANGSSSSPSFVIDWASTPNITENAFSQKPSGALIVGAYVNRGNVNTTSMTGTGVTKDAAVTGVGRGIDNFHVTGPSQGNNAVTANYAGAQAGIFMACAIG